MHHRDRIDGVVGAAGAQQRHVQFAGFQHRARSRLEQNRHVDLDVRVARRKAGQDVGDEAGGEIVRRAEPHRAGDLRRPEARQRLLGKLQDPAAVADERLAVGRQDHRPAVFREERPAHLVLELLHLHRDGRGRAEDGPSGAVEAARIGDCHQGPQKVDIKAGAAAEFGCIFLDLRLFRPGYHAHRALRLMFNDTDHIHKIISFD